jgi:hypothetical protein
MLKHIVLWKLHPTLEGRPKTEWALDLKRALEGLKGKIPQIRELEVGINFNPADTASDLSLYTVFANRDDLELYQKHPEHQKVVELVKKVTTERRVSDYED